MRGVRALTYEIDNGEETLKPLTVYDNSYALMIGIDDYNYEKTKVALML